MNILLFILVASVVSQGFTASTNASINAEDSMSRNAGTRERKMSRKKRDLIGWNRLANNIYAFNTDIEGINKSLDSIYTKINNKNILILGSGGSSKTIEYLFKEHNTVQIASREPNLDSISYNLKLFFEHPLANLRRWPSLNAHLLRSR